jgi:hypothetical protein
MDKGERIMETQKKALLLFSGILIFIAAFSGTASAGIVRIQGFEWHEDTITAPEIEPLELSFHINRDSVANWQLDANAEEILSFANIRMTSAGTINIEIHAIAAADAWKEMTVQTDLDASTVQYRFKAVSDNWQGRFDSNIGTEYFGHFESTHGNNTLPILDDLSLSTVPSSATMFLLGLGGLLVR